MNYDWLPGPQPWNHWLTHCILFKREGDELGPIEWGNPPTVWMDGYAIIPIEKLKSFVRKNGKLIQQMVRERDGIFQH